ncbi:chain-length determining protein [Alsobacter metallidurans]|uniref:non-specific protein-tyrosine kinase n=1 Tax=Alsobacter metallidurans TaxID=340221 RepID=A0A917I6Q5_9HYPH|nr:Wzz/FepE/Etk N-terminal domain-containing protein [Alsobacter metallidurans]GGH17278.1 chain-length determining protein [Alsobacter metallidurans]
MLDSTQRGTFRRISAVDLGRSEAGDISFFVGVARRRKRLIWAVVAVAVAIGFLLLVLVPPTFKARAVVLIDFKRLAALEEDFSTSSGRIDSSAVLSQIEILKSESVIDRTVVAEKLDEDPEFIGKPSLLTKILSWIGAATNPTDLPPDERRRRASEAVVKALAVDRIDLSYTISIDFVARSAEKAARLANAIAAMYIQDQLQAKREASEKASTWFSERIAELQADVNTADRKAVEYRLRNNIMSSDGKFIDEQQLSDLSQKLVQARLMRVTAEAKVEQIRQILANGATQGTLVDEFSNEVIVPLRNAYLEAKRTAAEFSLRYGANHDSVAKVKSKMNELENAIADEFKRIQQGAKSDMEIARSREQTLQSELSELARASADAQGARVELHQLESGASAVKSIRDTFMSRYVEGIQKQGFPITEARVITKALAPQSPSFPTPAKCLGGGALLGLGFGFFLAISLEAFSSVIRTKRQAEDAAMAPCIGYLPLIPPQVGLKPPPEQEGEGQRARRSPRLSFVARAPFSLYAETLRSLKVSVDLNASAKCSIVAFTSCAGDDGKTTVAANFAEICGLDGERALLIDLNLRRPAMSNMLAPHAQAGIHEVLTGAARFSDAIFSTDRPSLSFMPALAHGQSAADMGASLDVNALRKLLEAARLHFRYVILDLPPAGVVAEPRLISSLIDGFVLVLKWDKTKASTVRDCLRANIEIAQKLIGTVLNQVNTEGLLLSQDAHAQESSYLTYHS